MTARDTAGDDVHPADRHDLIRVQGARVNNLRDVSAALPKRRLAVFTGVPGSGKSSLVFGTLAAESQRLLNETHSAFVQGFRTTVARPDVDLLDGLTTADWIIDLGPGACADGGRVVFEGTPANLVADGSTLTAQHLAVAVG